MGAVSKYILLVDDDADGRELIAEVLRGEGFAVACVSNGLDALEHLGKSGVPALVIMDLTMPVMDGKQFLAERRKWSCLTQVPFVVLTGNTSVTAEELGAADVLYKPVDLDRLIALARRYQALASGLYSSVDETKTKSR